jgi:putative aminopeptidase
MAARGTTGGSGAQERLKAWLIDLMMTSGLSGHEGPVRRLLAKQLSELGITSHSDRMGNLIGTLPGDKSLPSVMLFAHMDQLGLVVRKIEASGLLRVERVGGVPEKALPSQAVRVSVGNGKTIPGIIANKSHHATQPEEKYKVLPYADLYIDCGFGSAAEIEAAGVAVGAPIVYAPHAMELAGGRIVGTSVDDRAGCTVMLEVARTLKDNTKRPTLHLVFSVQEEFNLRGAVTAAQALNPDIAIQLDLILATDTPDMTTRGDVKLGGGPGISLYSFHGRGTLNGTIPHPALVQLFEQTAAAENIPLQRSAHIGALTDSSYVQVTGTGVACIDLGFPTRYTHSSLEMCALADLEGLAQLLVAGITRIDNKFSLDRDRYLE